MTSKLSPNWQANLRLKFIQRDLKSILSERSHSGPLRVQRPFYPEAENICHVYILHPPGGIVSGDDLKVDIAIEERAWGLITAPGATKIYRNNRKQARQSVHIKVKSQGTAEWLPQESIFYDDAAANTQVRADVASDAKFVGWEITCLGRPASGQNLKKCNIKNRFEIWKDGIPIVLERARYVTGHPVFGAAWGLRSCPVTGILICTESDSSLLQQVRESTAVGNESLFAATQVRGVLVCRYLGFKVQEAKHTFRNIWNIIRPNVLGAQPVNPRIWNT